MATSRRLGGISLWQIGCLMFFIRTVLTADIMVFCGFPL